MAHFAEGLERRRADALGGGIRGYQFGPGGLEFLQFTQQPVVFGIGYDRVVEDVVAVIMLV